MPYYEYHCPTNGRTVEVRHGMNQRVETWGELAALAGAEVDDAPRNAPVERLLSVTAPVPGYGGSTGAARRPDFRGCGGGCACAPD